VLRSSNFFINPSHGIDPTFAQSGVNGPSIFPNTTIGLRLKWSPKPSFYLQTVVLNGVAGDPANPNGTRLTFAGSNGILSATEIALVNSTPVETTTSSGREHFHRVGRVTYPEYQGKVGLGFWFYTTEPEPVFAPPSDTVGHEVGGNLGLYLIAEQTVFHEKEEHEQYLRVFTRLGYANPKIYRFAYYVGGGFAYTGLIPGRDQDVSGIAVAGAYNGSEYKQYVLSHGRPVHSAEWNIEVSYRVMLAPWLRLQPDLQYIVHPNTNPALQNALTIGLQTVIIL
jgi:porin